MSRTFALEVQVSKNGTQLKKFSEDVVCSGDDKDVSTLLNVLQKTKDTSNEFLTTLVEADREAPIDIGGAVISHTKRKHENGQFDKKFRARRTESTDFCFVFVYRYR